MVLMRTCWKRYFCASILYDSKLVSEVSCLGIVLSGFFFNVRYVGCLFVKASGKPLEILTKLNELAGFSLDEEIELFEVSVSSYCYMHRSPLC